MFHRTHRFLALFLLLNILTFADTPNSEQTNTQSITVWGIKIGTIQSKFRDISPKERAENAEKRIQEIPAGLDHYTVKAIAATEGNVSGAWITVNHQNIFGVMENDFDPTRYETFDLYTDDIVKNLTKWLDKREQQLSWPLLLKAIGFSFIATFLFFILFKALLHYNHKIAARLENENKETAPILEIGNVNIRPYLATLGIGLLRIIVWGLGLPLIYGWITFVFRQFPYTQSWGLNLTDLIMNLLGTFATDAIDALPGLLAVVVIFLITRLIIRVFNTFFDSIESNSLHVEWMEPETARASRRVVTVLVWIFALVVAYPYIPGSQSDAFKGITVFLGLMLSLGSAGIVGQVIGGVLVVYTKAFQTGDYVKIDNYEGNIEDIGVLSTRLRTLLNEEIVIPNAVLLSATVTNYSRHVRKGNGATISTTITIGYDTPWRQVHAMLEMAAKRVQLIRTNPAPVVFQKALSDFYVEYTMRVIIEKPELRYIVLSQLHGHIQDVFNEYGVQIMSPNFEAQPEGVVLVPKEQWYAAPAKPQES